MPTDPSPLDIAQLPESDELALSPKLALGVPAVEIAVVPATHAGAPTLAVLGALNLTSRQSILYGPNARQVLRLVAFDPLRGLVYQAELAGPHAPNIGPMSRFNPAPPPPPPTGAALPTSFGFNFNEDVRSWLDLPREASRYTLAAWMEDLVSQPQVVHLPAGTTQPPVAHFVARRGSVRAVSTGAEPGAPVARSGAVVVGYAPPEQASKHLFGRMMVTIGPEIFAKDANASGEAERYVAVLAQTALDRRVAVLVLRIAEPTGGGPIHLRVEISDLFPPELRQPLFLLALAGQTVSQPLTVLPRGWTER